MRSRVITTAVGLLIMAAIVIAIAVAAVVVQGSKEPTIEELLSEVPLIDGHNDLPYQMFNKKKNKLEEIDLYNWPDVHTDIPRLREGKVGGQFWALYVSCSTINKDAVRACLDQLDVIHRFVKKYPEAFQLATSVSDIWNAFNRGRVASLIGMEGGHCIDSSLATLRTFYDLGVRYLTITHNCNTPWAEQVGMDNDNSDPTTHVGLTEFGKSLIKEMNRLGMLVDLSHVSHKTMEVALEITEAPVIFSHSSSFTLCNSTRNVKDDILHKTKINRGLVMVNFYNNFVTCNDYANLTDVANHIHYIRNLIGADYVGIGGDYDGVSRTPVGLEDVSKYPDLFKELRNRGWSTDELKKLAGLNLLRVLGVAEEVSVRMRRRLTPIEVIIPQQDLVKNNNTVCRSISGS